MQEPLRLCAMRAVVTGGIACGKSLFAEHLRRNGVDTLDADDIVRSLESPGGAAVEEIAAAFGRRMLLPDGSVDRAALAAEVFGPGREESRRRLEGIIHPKTRKSLLEWLDARPRPGPRAAVVPLLFETGWDRDFDFIVCVSADRRTQLRRMVELRGMRPEDAEARLAAQMPCEEKEKRSSAVVRNCGSAGELARKAREIAQAIARAMEEERT